MKPGLLKASVMSLMTLMAFTALSLNTPIARAAESGGKPCAECEVKQKQAELAKLQAKIAELQAVVDQAQGRIACYPEKMESAPIGTRCTSGSTVWEVQSDNGLRVFYDTKSGLKVTGIVAESKNFSQAQASCPAGYHLPSAGIKDWIKRTNDPNNQTGEFATLNADGVRTVIPGIQNRWFWKSPPYGSLFAFGFVGVGADFSYGAGSRDDYYFSVICVRGP